MHFSVLLLVAAISLFSTTFSSSSSSFTTCKSQSVPSKCGDKPDVHIPLNSFDPDSPFLRWILGGEQLSPAHPNQSKKCSKELESIIYVPPNPARDYLLKIARTLTNAVLVGGGFGSTQSLGLVQNVVTTYNVTVEIQFPFASRPNLLFTPHQPVSLAVRQFGHLLGPTYLGQAGFQYNSETKTYSVAVFTQNLNTAIGVTIIVSVSAETGVFYNCIR